MGGGVENAEGMSVVGERPKLSWQQFLYKLAVVDRGEKNGTER